MSPATKQEIKEWLEAEYAEAQGPFTAEKVGAPAIAPSPVSSP